MIQKLDMRDPEMAQKLLDIEIPAYQVEADIIGSTKIPYLLDTVDKIQSSKETFFGYWVDGNLAGVISFMLEGNVVDIYRLVVSPQHFRQGIGAKLLSFLFTHYTGMEKFLVQTGADNIPAMKLYKKFGFQEIDRLEIEPGLLVSRLETRDVRPNSLYTSY
ncbi:Acetyltransferase (GNAT) domain-containing protein [Thermoactinomyces sp. DSM 45891]|uniref:GNAT family N-acetyltransferase n=1 Tax=Thermoactinomyces sp. DSM 45891 TaxID=1761907 RepID=UPI0009191841|nr:GNAT family N-acetyltransferase [Thermoactinomyces sp. DSM 45891]SFX49315.1 Acetyltransferase (GNAT) domain-containing protein [Thermoactinomyces sp. DSM 45891]